jgi:tetrahydromethanopterin S-methyltransferase subunit B
MTLVFGPIIYGIRSNATEIKRVDILLNKTREESAMRFVTKEELIMNMDRVIERIDKLDAKIDKLITH